MIKEYHNARYPFVFVQTDETPRLIRESRQNVRKDVQFWKWNCVEGFRIFEKVEANGSDVWLWKIPEMSVPDPDWEPDEEDENPPSVGMADILKPEDALKAIRAIEDEAVIFFFDFPRFVRENAEGNVNVIRQALEIKGNLKGSGKTVVFTSPTLEIPIELESSIVVDDGFRLPGKKSLRNTLETICSDNEIDVPDDADAIVENLQGVQEENAENILAFSLVKNKGKIDYKDVLDQKAALLKASGALKYGKYPETFEDMFGCEYMKEFALGTIESPDARGILIGGIRGTGKSLFSKCLSNAVKRPLLVGTLGKLRGKYVGETEARTDTMFKTIFAFGNPVVFLDEIEKSISGTAGAGDSGVGQRILQRLLIEMEDRGGIPENKIGPYWNGTCNNLVELSEISGGAMLRRFDAIFWVDFPTSEECWGIAEIWNRKKNVAIPSDFDFSGWTGADIAKLARIMSMFGDRKDPSRARKYIVPTRKQISDRQYQEMRRVADRLCIPANAPKQKEPKVYKRKVEIGG